MRPESGADRTIVHRRLVPRSAQTGKKGLFKSFTGQDSWLDLADVTIEVAGQQYLLEVAVMDNLRYDALLGMDIPDLFQSLRKNTSESVMAVNTRAQLRHASEEQETDRQEKEDAAMPTPLPSIVGPAVDQSSLYQFR